MATVAPTNGQHNGQKQSLGERFADIRKLVEDNRESIFSTAAAGVDAAYYTSCFLRAISKNKQLADCTNVSLRDALADSATHGLPINSIEGDGYLVPRRRGVKVRGEWEDVWEAQFQAGYLGKLKLAYESPLVAGITVEAVREGDHYVVRLGHLQEIEHEPGEARGALTHIYAVLWLASGARRCVSWTIPEIEEHAKQYVDDKSFGNKKGAWQTSFRPMACKVVLNQLLKYAPTSDRTRRLLQTEEYADAGIEVEQRPMESGSTLPTDDLDRLADPPQEADGVSVAATNGDWQGHPYDLPPDAIPDDEIPF